MDSWTFAKAGELERQRIHELGVSKLNEIIRKAEYEANLRVENMRIIEQAVCKRPPEKIQDRVWKGKIEPWMICWDKFCVQSDELSSILDMQAETLERQRIAKAIHDQERAFNLQKQTQEAMILFVKSGGSYSRAIPARDYEERLREQER